MIGSGSLSSLTLLFFLYDNVLVRKVIGTLKMEEEREEEETRRNRENALPNLNEVTPFIFTYASILLPMIEKLLIP